MPSMEASSSLMMRRSTSTYTPMRRRTSIQCPVFSLDETDKEVARTQYIKLRKCIRDAFESFLRNLNLKSLSALEQAFQTHGGELNSSEFLKVVSEVFPAPETDIDVSHAEKTYIMQMACLILFESVDVDCSCLASWMEFVEFVCAIAEELRLQAAEESGQTFDFSEAENLALPFRPAVTKCHFDKAFFWPQHPSDCAVIFEEGQSGFHLHYPKTMARRRRVEGHRQELLSATFMPAPFKWVVTSGNDNTVCFWDENFNLVKRWTLDHVWTGEKGKVTSASVLCWCHEIKALYAADHFSEKVRAWRIDSPFDVRASDAAFEPDKRFELRKHMTHTKPVQAICWLSSLKCLATASLDTTVQIFDIVQMKRTYLLQGHKRGLTCLQYCQGTHMLLSCGFDNYICIWDPGAGTLSFTFEGHACSIASLCKMPHTDYEFVSVDFEGEVRVWDVRRLVCLQSFSATDRQAEKNGEIEPLEPRSVCAVGQNRVLISGRRMVVFDREAPNPHLTADWQIHCMTYNTQRIEIVTHIKNDLYVWCALTGRLRTVHDNVFEGTITAMTLSDSERRIFVGADDGEIVVVNYGCGAKLKNLTPHAYEVTQIMCIPEKVLTLSAPEKMIVVHDDNEVDRAVVLKRIDLSEAGAVTNFACDWHSSVLACTSQDWKVVWYNMDFAKEVSRCDGYARNSRSRSLLQNGDEEWYNMDAPDENGSDQGEVKHMSAVTCCTYMQDAPLLATADADGSVIFWSMPPLRTFSFFKKIMLDFEGQEGPFMVSSIALSYPDEEFLYVGMERGMLACIDIREIVQEAKNLRQEILRRKESGEAAAVISGRIFEEMPKPCNRPEYVFKVKNFWEATTAHRSSIDKVIVCPRQPPVVLTLGQDQRVRIWSYDTGEALGTLEQGLPKGLHHVPETEWRFPINAAEELALDMQRLVAAAEEAESDSESSWGPAFSESNSSEISPPRSRNQSESQKVDERNSRRAPSAAGASVQKRAPSELSDPSTGAKAERGKDQAKPPAGGGLTAVRSAPDLRAGAAGAAAKGRPSSGGGSPGKRKGGLGDAKGSAAPYVPGSRFQALTSYKTGKPDGEEWYAGPHSMRYFANTAPQVPPMSLPKLPNGMQRPKFNKSKDLVAAARRLSSALGDIDVRNSKDFL